LYDKELSGTQTGVAAPEPGINGLGKVVGDVVDSVVRTWQKMTDKAAAKSGLTVDPAACPPEPLHLLLRICERFETIWIAMCDGVGAARRTPHQHDQYREHLRANQRTSINIRIQTSAANV